MFFIFLGAIVATIVLITTWCAYEEGALALLAAVFAGVVVCLGSLPMGAIVYDSYPKEYSFNVVAAKDNSVTQGSFSIFGGSINEEPYYFFYRKYADGGIRQGHIPANGTVIYEDQESKTFITVTYCKMEMRFWGMTDPCERSYEIHAPAGSVDRSVEFDLEGG